MIPSTFVSRIRRPGYSAAATVWLLLCVGVSGALWLGGGASSSSSRPSRSSSAGLGARPALHAPAPGRPCWVTKPIESLVEGDRVLSRDQHDPCGPIRPRRVEAAYRKTSDHLRRVRVLLADGTVQELKATDDHPFFVAGRGWVKAAELRSEDHLQQVDGPGARVLSSVREERPAGVAVFNLRVAGDHTYFASAPNATGPPLWTHNMNCPPEQYVGVSVGGKALPGYGRVRSADPTRLAPSEVNFSQRTVSSNVEQYVADMTKPNGWDWQISGPIRVMQRDGQWVSYDNRRLMAARMAGLEEIPVQVVRPEEMYSATKTWEEMFVKRFSDPRNVAAGGIVPDTGLPQLPTVARKPG